jgi:broad specificity phosphatase PhoE
MTRLLLVKHSVPAIDENLPSAQWTLSDEGRRRCVWLTAQLRAHGVTRLYTSPEPKAEATARLAAGELGAELYVHKDLRENDRSNFDFLEAGEFRTRLKAFFDEPAVVSIGTESANDAISRFAAAVEQAMGESRGRSIAIIAHGAVITLFVTRYNRAPAFALWDHLGMPSYVALDATSYRFDGKIHNFPG